MLSTLLLVAIAAGAPVKHTDPAPGATAIVDSAIARMGGRAALEGVVRIRRELITQWQRMSFEQRPYVDMPSYEHHFDVRDYSLMAWRNTRRFMTGGDANQQPVIDIVRDSVGIRLFRGQWNPLNVAYVDERDELFTFAPERLLLHLRAATDLKALSDTAIGGLPHHRVAATVRGYPSVLFVRQADGLPAMVRFRAGQPNDFGLAPWGDMEVEIWFSRWGSFAGRVMLPTQWDTRRVGRGYKRITVLATAFDTVATADSFAISDSLRGAFLATARKPMHDLPLDSAKVMEGRFAAFRTNGAPVGAVKLGGEWWLLESGQAPFNAERAAHWLEQEDAGTRTAGAFITASSANGGIGWLVAKQRTVRAAPAFQAMGVAMLRNRALRPPPGMTVTRGQWQVLGGDSVYIEPIDYADAPGGMYLYVPSLKWAYSAGAIGPVQQAYLLRRLRERQFVVERTGHSRGVLNAVPAGVLSVQ
jgi:hypothetical protein